MLFLAQISLTDPVAARPHLAAEMQHLQELSRTGVLRSFLLRADGRGAFLILQAEDEAQAGREVSALPLITSGVASHEVIPVTEPPL